MKRKRRFEKGLEGCKGEENGGKEGRGERREGGENVRKEGRGGWKGGNGVGKVKRVETLYR